MSELKERPTKSVKVLVDDPSDGDYQTPSAYLKRGGNLGRIIAHCLTFAVVFLFCILVFLVYAIGVAKPPVSPPPNEQEDHHHRRSSSETKMHEETLEELSRYLSLLKSRRMLGSFIQSVEDSKILKTAVAVDKSFMQIIPLYRLGGESEVVAATELWSCLALRHYLLSTSVPSPSPSSQNLREASFVANRLYYHPIRRYTTLSAFSKETSKTLEAWQGAVGATLPLAHGPALRHNPHTHKRMEDIIRHLGDTKLPQEKADKPTIFISFAAYRDVECAPTLVDIMQKAKNIHRIHVGIAQQNRAEDPFPCITPALRVPIPCYSPLPPGSTEDPASAFSSRLCVFSDNIRIRQIRAERARGPTFGRFLASLLYQNEDMVLVLDSHNRFRPMFDSLLVSMLGKIGEPKAVFSHYPEAYTEGNYFNLYSPSTTYLCRCEFTEFGYPKFFANVVNANTGYKNIRRNEKYSHIKASQVDPRNNYVLPQPFIAGGFLFTSFLLMREVPFDPFLGSIFDGEEFLYAVRLWTHGFNLYSPPLSVAYHFYGRPTAPKVWDDKKDYFYVEQAKSRERIHLLVHTRTKAKENKLLVPPDHPALHTGVDLSRYGTGEAREVEEYYQYSGVDPVARKCPTDWC